MKRALKVFVLISLTFLLCGFTQSDINKYSNYLKNNPSCTYEGEISGITSIFLSGNSSSKNNYSFYGCINGNATNGTCFSFVNFDTQNFNNYTINYSNFNLGNYFEKMTITNNRVTCPKYIYLYTSGDGTIVDLYSVQHVFSESSVKEYIYKEKSIGEGSSGGGSCSKSTSVSCHKIDVKTDVENFILELGRATDGNYFCINGICNDSGEFSNEYLIYINGNMYELKEKNNDSFFNYPWLDNVYVNYAPSNGYYGFTIYKNKEEATKDAQETGEKTGNYLSEENINKFISAAENISIPNVNISFCSDDGVQKVLKFIGYLLLIGKILVPILLIVFGVIEYGKVTISSDNDTINKATKNFVFKILAGIVIFILPTIINFIFYGLVKNNANYNQCRACVFERKC